MQVSFASGSFFIRRAKFPVIILAHNECCKIVMTRSKSEKFVKISHLRRLGWLEKAWNAAKCKHGKWVCNIIVRIVCTLFKQLHCVYVCSLTTSCVPRDNERRSKYLCSLNINKNLIINKYWLMFYLQIKTGIESIWQKGDDTINIMKKQAMV